MFLLRVGLRAFFIALFLAVVAPEVRADQEYLIVSGGPALRRWENLRRAGEQHDRWWGNFIATAVTRIREIRRTQPTMPVTWLVYRDAYARRGAEDQKPYTSWVAEKAVLGIKIVYFTTGDELISYINRGQGRGRTKISGFEYYGHSNKFCFMFDYSSEGYGVSSSWLHQNDLRKINGSAFAPNAYCHSWGCHTGEAMSQKWQEATGIWMVGAYGKTDYTDLHLRDNRPGLSSGSHWRKKD
jgi:hypothetical protein